MAKILDTLQRTEDGGYLLYTVPSKGDLANIAFCPYSEEDFARFTETASAYVLRFDSKTHCTDWDDDSGSYTEKSVSFEKLSPLRFLICHGKLVGIVLAAKDTEIASDYCTNGAGYKRAKTEIYYTLYFSEHKKLTFQRERSSGSRFDYTFTYTCSLCPAHEAKGDIRKSGELFGISN